MGTQLTSFLETITNALKSVRLPFPSIPAVLMLCDIKNRSGLSALSLGTSIISRLPEIGIPNGPNDDGSENLVNKFVMLVSEELVREIKENGIAETVAEPGGIVLTLQAGPYQIPVINQKPIKIRGGLQ